MPLPTPRIGRLLGWLQLALSLLVAKTVLITLALYPRYFPPDFQVDFLLGRDGYFWGPYAVAFYPHIVAGPLTLAGGIVLLSARFRRRWSLWHRRIGRVQALLVLFVVAPSGLWMAGYAVTGPVAGAGFATLSVVTAVSVAMGWREAVARRFAAHERWMQRTFALLCSAVVVRLVGGISELTDATWTYPYAAWLGWLLPLAVVEAVRRSKAQSLRTSYRAATPRSN